MRDYYVRDLMTEEVITLSEEQSLPLAHDLMKLTRIRHIPVVDKGGRLVGLITHRDLLRAQVSYQSFVDESKGAIDPVLPVATYMTRDVWSISPNAGAFEAGQLLLDHNFSCLPVVNDDHVVIGIITDRDFLKYALEVLQRFDSASDSRD